MRIVMLGSGRGSNAEAVLVAQREGRLGKARVEAVFSDVPNAGILALGSRFGVPASFIDPAPFRTKLEGDGEARFIAAISAVKPDLVVLAGFMRVLKPRFLEAFAGRIINLHPSLLPKFPGLDGIGQALRAGVSETGCTVHYVTAELDGGPILGQSIVPVSPADTHESLAAKVHAAEHVLLPRVIARLSDTQATEVPGELWESRMEIPSAAVEEVEASLLESGFDGWSILEDAVGRRAWVVGIFNGEVEAAARWSELKPMLPKGTAGRFTPRLLPDADWKNSYRDHFKAWTFGRLHWVPVWERETFRLPEGHAVLWLDPGMAFGTGNHETTRLCIERLVEFEAGRPGGGSGLRVIDAGCGSGILALSACLLGSADVSGFDNDPEAVRVSVENADLNHLGDRVRFAVAGLPDGLRKDTADVVLANIQSDILALYAGELAAAVAPDGMLAMSGILAGELGKVREAFAPVTRGWTSVSRVLGEWCDLALQRPR